MRFSKRNRIPATAEEAFSKVLLSESPGGVEEVTSLGDGRKSDGGWLQEQDMDQRTQVLTTK